MDPNRRIVLVIPPEYFPSPGVAASMVRADEIVLLDTAQYSRQSFQNRTRIRNPDGAQWLTIPVRSGQFGDGIDGTEIDTSSGWRRIHDKALRFNYSTSPFFQHYRPRLDAVFNVDGPMLADVTCTAMQVAADLLGCPGPVVRASRMAGRPSTTADIMARHADGVLLIPDSARHVGPGGEARLTGDDPHAVCAFTEVPWRQNFAGFVSGSGSLDLLFNLGPDARDYLLTNSRLVP